MKVYNQDKTQVLETYDLLLGYLKEDFIDLPEVQAVKEQGHYETITEYPNGGKDIEWVVDSAGVEYQPARKEKIQVYVPYTEQELSQRQAERKIFELKRKLSETDYKAIKFAEGELSAEEYAEAKEQRRQWRAEINALEARL